MASGTDERDYPARAVPGPCATASVTCDKTKSDYASAGPTVTVMTREVIVTRCNPLPSQRATGPRDAETVRNIAEEMKG